MRFALRAACACWRAARFAGRRRVLARVHIPTCNPFTTSKHTPQNARFLLALALVALLAAAPLARADGAEDVWHDAEEEAAPAEAEPTPVPEAAPAPAPAAAAHTTHKKAARAAASDDHVALIVDAAKALSSGDVAPAKALAAKYSAAATEAAKVIRIAWDFS